MRRTRTFWLGLCALMLFVARASSAEPGAAKEPKTTFIWPEIRDPAELVKIARENVEKQRTSKEQYEDTIFIGCSDRRLSFLKPLHINASRHALLVVLDTHPFNGQALLITADAQRN